MIGRELKRILQKPTAFVCIVVYMGIMILGVESDLRARYEIGFLNLFWVTENFGVTIFIQTLIFPVAAAGNYFDERKGHYDWLIQMRSGQLRYCIAKIVSAVLGGIILYMISVILFFAVCVIFIPEVRHGSTVESITNLFQSKSYVIIYWLLSNRHSIGISVFTSYWDLCIAWIMCICVLYKSLCILCDAIFAYKNRDVYWRFCRIICIYSIRKRTFS